MIWNRAFGYERTAAMRNIKRQRAGFDAARQWGPTLAVAITAALLAGCGGGSAGGPGTGSPPGTQIGGTPAGGTGGEQAYSFGSVTARAVSNSPLTPITA